MTLGEHDERCVGDAQLQVAVPRGPCDARITAAAAAAAAWWRWLPSIVLLTRGLRGCYVYFMDASTRDFFLSRTEGARINLRRAAELRATYEA